MTVQEDAKAIESALKKLDDQRINFGMLERFDVDENFAVTQALEEIKLYRALGTVEELKEAREKQVAKKPIIWENKSYEAPVPNDDWGYECPCCGNRDIDYPEHHCECGQALDWSEEDD